MESKDVIWSSNILKQTEIVCSPWLPQTHKQTIFQITLAFPPYFLSPGTMMALSDCELHPSIHARLHAQNDTHPSSIIVYWIISNRCRLWFWIVSLFVFIYCTFSFYYCSNFVYWNLAVFITCYWNNKLTNSYLTSLVASVFKNCWKARCPFYHPTVLKHWQKCHIDPKQYLQSQMDWTPEERSTEPLFMSALRHNYSM